MRTFEVGRDLPVGGAPRLYVRAESWASAVLMYQRLCHESDGMFDSQLGVDVAEEQDPTLVDEDMLLYADDMGLLRVRFSDGREFSSDGSRI